MGKQVLFDVRFFAGGADLSGQSNKVELSDEIEVREVTNFRSGGAKQRVAGVEQVEAQAEGQWEAGDPGMVDDSAWASRRALEPLSVAVDAASDLAAGGPMYLTSAHRQSFGLLGEVGGVAPWMGSWVGSWPLARGRCLHPSGTPRTANGSGVAYQLGAVGAGQWLYANLHVLSATGTSPSLTVTVQSATDAVFTSPTTRATFTAATGPGGQSVRVSGPITDQWWRVGYTVSGTTPSFLFLASLGIA